MQNNIVAAELSALAMCRRDGGDLYVVEYVTRQGRELTSNTFPLGYANEFAATEIANGGTAKVSLFREAA